jgi:Fe-Mn family superoxide dismutase
MVGETNMNDQNARTTSRRTFLAGALAAAPLALVGARLAHAAAPSQTAPAPDTGTGPFTLPPLPYRFDALEPHIDARTMQIHHDRHHAAYVKNLNDAAAKTPELAGKSAEELIRKPGRRA